MDANDFYEDDEPIEDVRAVYEAGEKGVTVSRCDRCGQIIEPQTTHVRLGDVDLYGVVFADCCATVST